MNKRLLDLDASHLLHPYCDPVIGGSVAEDLFVEGVGCYLIVRPLADYVILSPPLIMSNNEADWLVDVMAESIQATAEEVGKT